MVIKYSRQSNSSQTTYQIRIEGHLGCQWLEWFDGLTITLEKSGCTLLSGPVEDQAALYGLLRKVRDLGLPLLLVERVNPDPVEASEDNDRSIEQSFV